MKHLVASLVFLSCALPMVAACVVGDERFLGAVFHAGTGYWGMALPIIAVGLVLCGVPRWGAGVGVLALWWGSWVVPGHFGSVAEGPGEIRIVTANVLAVNPRIDEALEQLLAEDADVLVLQEVSYAWAEALDRVEDYPYRYVQPGRAAFGIAILSRHPWEGGPVDLEGVTMLEARLTVAGRRLDLWTVHTLPPRNAEYTAVWAEQMRILAAKAASHETPLVLAGDLNATRHHPAYRRLLAVGLRDSHAVVGRASAKTWPNGVFPIPQLRLDHVLISDELSVHALREGEGAGSDHRPIVIELTVTKG